MSQGADVGAAAEPERGTPSASSNQVIEIHLGGRQYGKDPENNRDHDDHGNLLIPTREVSVAAL